MKRGIRVTCATCGYMKKPIGRSRPLGVVYCEPTLFELHDGCPGYYEDPKPGSLWPGETEQEFGYPVGVNGTEETE